MVKALSKGPMTSEDISQALNIPFGNLLTAISMLELQEIIEKDSDGKYKLK